MIYCVEDERNIRELLVYTLHSTGFEAKGLENGTQLFEELGNLIPDLILLDIMLPGDDGYTILEKIRKITRKTRVNMNHFFILFFFVFIITSALRYKLWQKFRYHLGRKHFFKLIIR